MGVGGGRLGCMIDFMIRRRKKGFLCFLGWSFWDSIGIGWENLGIYRGVSRGVVSVFSYSFHFLFWSLGGLDISLFYEYMFLFFLFYMVTRPIGM